ncbi:acyl-CoA dehydrogenase family protein [Streptomyces sp. NPDC002143]
MVDLKPDEEHRAVAELARTLGLELLDPAARQAEADAAVPAAVWQTLTETGLTLQIPEKLGGGGVLDTVTHMIAVENLAYGDPAITLAASWSGAATLLLGLHGTSTQTADLSALFSDPGARGSVAMHEGYGRRPREYATAITTGARGSVQVTGRKVAVPFAREASHIFVVGNDPATGALRVAVVAPGTGVVVEDETPRLALDAAPTSTVSFDVTVSADDILGGPSSDSTAIAVTVERLRLVTAAAQIGTAQRAVDYAAHYATERTAFGRPIAGFQGVSFLLAEAHTRIAAARLEVAEAATLLDAGAADGGNGLGRASVAVHEATNYASEVATESTRDAVQVLGGHGFITDHPVELWYRSAAALASIDFDPLCSSFEPAL